MNEECRWFNYVDNTSRYSFLLYTLCCFSSTHSLTAAKGVSDNYWAKIYFSETIIVLLALTAVRIKLDFIKYIIRILATLFYWLLTFKCSLIFSFLTMVFNMVWCVRIADWSVDMRNQSEYALSKPGLFYCWVTHLSMYTLPTL